MADAKFITAPFSCVHCGRDPFGNSRRSTNSDSRLHTRRQFQLRSSEWCPPSNRGRRSGRRDRSASPRGRWYQYRGQNRSDSRSRFAGRDDRAGGHRTDSPAGRRRRRNRSPPGVTTNRRSRDRYPARPAGHHRGERRKPGRRSGSRTSGPTASPVASPSSPARGDGHASPRYCPISPTFNSDEYSDVDQPGLEAGQVAYDPSEPNPSDVSETAGM